MARTHVRSALRLTRHAAAPIAVLLVFLQTSQPAHAQESSPAAGADAPRRTPLGTMRPAPPTRRGPRANAPAAPAAPVESVENAIERAVAASGGRNALRAVQDSIAEGTLTVFNLEGQQVSRPVTVIRKGGSRVQRIVQDATYQLRLGTDGVDFWESSPLGKTRAQGPPLSFIESQTVHAVSNLLDHISRRRALRDGGMKGEARVIETVGPDEKTSRYFVDPSTSQVTRLEFVAEQTKDIFGGPIPIVEAWVFSDFRSVSGVSTPFKVERYRGGVKLEQMQFTSVRYNASVKDDVFRP